MPPGLLSARLPTWLPRLVTPWLQRREWLPSSLHHLPAIRVGCQLCSPDASQKRHVPSPSAPRDLGYVCPCAASFESAAPPGTAGPALAPAGSRRGRAGCDLAP